MPSTAVEEQQHLHSQADGNTFTATIAQPQNSPDFVETVLSFLKWVGDSVDQALCMLDELIATPMANVNAILGDLGAKFYDIVNTCKNTALWHGLIGAGVGVASFIGFCVFYYRQLRDQEKASHFFWFMRLLGSRERAKILKLLSIEGSDAEILSATVHFYSPDISKFVSWKRRFFCWGEKRESLKRLQRRFEEEGGKEVLLTKLFHEIAEKAVIILNDSANSKLYECRCKNQDGLASSKKADYSIELTKDCKEKNYFPPELLNKIELEKSLSLSAALLNAVGNASFIYWIAVFIFYLAPIGIVGGISIYPLIIAFSFLVVNLGTITYQVGKGTFDKNNNNSEDNAQKKAILEGKLIEIYKREAFIKYSGIKKVSFKNSKLYKDLKKILDKRHDRFNKFHVRLNGFVEGCFLPFFAIWLFSDLFTVLTWLVIGTTPAAPVLIGIAIITLLLGVGYGIYSARKAAEAEAQESRYEKLNEKITYLEDQNIEVAEVVDDDKSATSFLSLQAYDRLLRRYSLEEPLWTRIKKGLNRTWVIIKRLGTGSLVFRLVIWGTITACVGALIPSALVAPIAIPFIITFAVFFAVSYYRAYNAESKLKQAEEVVDHLYYKQRLITEQENLSLTSKSAMLVVDFPHKEEAVPQCVAKQEQALENKAPSEATEPVSVAQTQHSKGTPFSYTESLQAKSPAYSPKVIKCPNDDRTLSTTEEGNRVVEQSSTAVGKPLESLTYPSGRRAGLWQTHPKHGHIRFICQQPTSKENPPVCPKRTASIH